MSTPLVFWDVDTQADFMLSDGALCVAGAEAIMPNLKRLSDAARRYGIPVIASADDHELSDAEISDDPDFETTFPPHCMRDTAGAERVSETRQEWTLEVGCDPISPLEIRSGLAVDWPRILIRKRQLDLFGNPATDTVYRLLSPEAVVVYGVALDFCVRRIVDGLLERDQKDLTLVTDATRAIYPEEAASLLEEWRRAGVHFATVDELLDRLEPSRRAVG